MCTSEWSTIYGFICLKTLKTNKKKCAAYMVTLGAGSHWDSMGTRLFLCNSCAFPKKTHWIMEKLCKPYFFKMHCIKPKSTLIPCNLVPKNTLCLQSAFGVSLTVHWHPYTDSKGSTFTCGVGNTHKMHLVLVWTNSYKFWLQQREPSKENLHL